MICTLWDPPLIRASYLLPAAAWPLWGGEAQVLMVGAQVLMFVSHLRAMLTDPGSVPLEALPLKGETRKVACRRGARAARA